VAPKQDSDSNTWQRRSGISTPEAGNFKAQTALLQRHPAAARKRKQQLAAGFCRGTPAAAPATKFQNGNMQLLLYLK